MDKLIAKKYAKALMEKSDKKDIAGYLDILKAVVDAFSDEKISEVIGSPLIDKEKKGDLILSALGKKPDSTLVNLIRLMAQKNRLGLIPEMVSIMEFELKKASNKFEGTVYSDEKLSDDSVKKLEKSLASYSGAQISLSQSLNEQPGIKVEIEDLGIELGFSREKVKQALIDHIQKAL